MKGRRHLFVPAEPDEVRAWRKARVPELERLMKKYQSTIYVNNAKVTELKPKVKKVEHFDWKTI